MIRKGPQYSLSKVSLDDRDLPRKAKIGDRTLWVKAYYAYDVLSGSCIGAAYSLKKDADLFTSCFVDMFRFLDKHEMGMPMEVEVEHHIASLFKEDLLKADNLFPYVRWCAPGNSQEKRAEHFNNAKKYGYEKRYQEGIGRWYAKSEAKRQRQDKVWDGEKMAVQRKVYNLERLIADDRKVIEEYNKGIHRDQKTHEGKSRMDVFLENQNPSAPKFAPSAIARYVGVKVKTSIHRSKYIRAINDVYELPHPKFMAKLGTNNYSVEAYYMPTQDGIIPEVHVYQGERFIATCPKAQRFNEAAAEQTEEDMQILEQQAIYRERFKKITRTENPLHKVNIVRPVEEPEPEEVITVEYEPVDEFADIHFDDLLDEEEALAESRNF